jgi:hypothetical protein
MKKNYQVEIKVLDRYGRKVKELIAEIPGSTPLETVVESGRKLYGLTKMSSLKYEIHEQRR